MWDLKVEVRAIGPIIIAPGMGPAIAGTSVLPPPLAASDKVAFTLKFTELTA